MHRKALYPECGCLKHEAPNIEISDDVKESLLQDYRILPLYELRRIEYTGLKKYSMKRYDSLACGWTAYKKSVGHQHKTPFELPNAQDFHFYNGHVVHDPKLSTGFHKNHPLHMRAGPGIDYLRQLPIPNDTSLRPKKAPKIQNGKSAILRHRKTKIT